MKQLSNEQFDEYLNNPYTSDNKVRKWASVPEDKYYSVSMWPEHLKGRVFVIPKLHRAVTAKKISKSD